MLSQYADDYFNQFKIFRLNAFSYCPVILIFQQSSLVIQFLLTYYLDKSQVFEFYYQSLPYGTFLVILKLINQKINIEQINNQILMGKSYLTVNSCLVLLILFAMEGSSTLYSVSPDFKVSFQKSHSELAHVYYRQLGLSTGWNYLHVYANPEVSLIDQHKGAGFLQGYVSYKQIYFAYKNMMASIIKAPTLSLKAQTFINDQLDYIDNICENHENQLFRIYAQAYMQQLRFMYRGFLARINEENQLGYYIGFTEFYYLTNIGDLEDLIPAFHQSQKHQQKLQQKQQKLQNLQKQKLGNCNAIAKIIDGKIVVGHSTHNIYEFLLRIYKTYSFPSRDPRIGSQWYSFSSRPGDLISKDDFYILSNGMIVLETSLSNYNDENYKSLSPQTLPAWLRQCVAVNLARSNSEWAEYFLKYRSGTHNNQWVIINPNNLANKKDVVIFVEQAFDIFRVSDMSQTLLTQGYIATYNMPYNQKIYDKLGTTGNDYQTDPRAIQYKQLFPLLNDEEDFKTLLLQNKNQDKRSGIAPRYDLSLQGATPFGLTDLKVYSPKTLADNFIWAYSGPAWSSNKDDNLPAFDWKPWNSNSHEGMAQVWNFTFEKHFIDYEKVVGQNVINQIIAEQ